jgi:hypothetical protein
VIFIDTGAWVALELPRESKHGAAAACLERIRGGVHGAAVTSDFVLDETLTLLRMKAGLAAAESVAKRAMESESVRVAYVGPETFRQAWEMMRSRRDKKWSLTDCTSFLLMRELGITVAFTLDGNFEEAGFERIPA